MAFNNNLNAKQQGTQYLSTSGAWSGIDGGTSGNVLTSNGTGIAPSFQSLGFPTNYAFTAALSANVNNVTGDGTLYQMIYDQVQQTGSAYNTGTGNFTAPATGYYQMNITVGIGNISTQPFWGIKGLINGSATDFLVNTSAVNVEASSSIILSASKIYFLSSGQTFSVGVFAGQGANPKTVSVLGGGGGVTGSWFSGYRIA